GAEEAEIRQAVNDAIEVRRKAADLMEGHALGQLGLIDTPQDPGQDAGPVRIRELVRIGAAYAVNCPSSLKKYLAAASAVAITQEETEAVARLAGLIRAKAISHVEKLVPLEEETAQTEKKTCGCKEPDGEKGGFFSSMMAKCC
ncbi:MAG: hypothetical protein V3R66_01020, partial [Rhodospirillales bacterium]